MTEPSIKRNYLFKLAYQILEILLPLVSAPYVARVLGADGIGRYSFSASVMAYFTMLASLGTGVYGTREIARCRDDRARLSRTFWEIEIMTAGTTLFAFLGWLAVIFLGGAYRPYFIALIPLLPAVFFDISWLYTGLEKVHCTVIWNMACKLLGLALLFLFVRKKEDAVLYVFLMSAASLFGNVSMWIYVPREVDPVPLRGLRFGRHFRQTAKYFLSSAAISVYTVLDKTMLGVLTKDAFQCGFYEQANKIIRMVKPLAFFAVNDVMCPRMSYLFAARRENEIRARIRTSMELELFLTVGCCFGLIAVSDSFVPLFFGPGYEPVALLLKAMAVILIPICISTCLGSHCFIPAGRIGEATRLILPGSVLNIAFNVPLILTLRSLGAVIASVAAETLIGILYVIRAKNYLDVKALLLGLAKKTAAGALMAAGVYGLSRPAGRTVLSLIAQIAAGAAAYFILLAAMRDASVGEILKFLKERLEKYG